jgi:hypothetical protein
MVVACVVGGKGGGGGTGNVIIGVATRAGEGVVLWGDATELIGLRLDREEVMLGLGAGAGGHCTTDTGTTTDCPGSKHIPAGKSSVCP